MALFPSPEHKQALLVKLRTLGVARIVVTFDGGGDSGTIYDPDLYNANNDMINIPDETLEWEQRSQVWDDTLAKWVDKTTSKTMPLGEILKELTNDALEGQGLDWYNNEGGQGSFTIDFRTSPPTINLDVGINIMTTDEHSFDYTDEEDELTQE